MNHKFYQLLGMAMRAGKLIAGEEQVVLGIRQGKVKLVILSRDASANTHKKISDKSSYYQVPLLQVDSRDDLGRAIGKDQRVVVGVTDRGFSNQLIAIYEQ